MAKTRKQAAAPVAAPAPTQPKSWEQLSDPEKIERLGIVAADLQQKYDMLLNAFREHKHVDGEIVGRMII